MEETPHEELRASLRQSEIPRSSYSQSLDQESDTNIVENIIDRIGIGKYHWLSYLVFSTFWLCDGAEVIAIALLSYVLKNVIWFKDPSEISLLASSIFAGFLVGSLLSGWITTAFGRKKPFLILLVLVFMLGILSAFSPSYIYLLVTRAIYGVVVGVLSPLSSSMIAEITPKNRRGVSFVLISSFFTVGELIAILVGATLKVDEPGSDGMENAFDMGISTRFDFISSWYQVY